MAGHPRSWVNKAFCLTWQFAIAVIMSPVNIIIYYSFCVKTGSDRLKPSQEIKGALQRWFWWSWYSCMSSLYGLFGEVSYSCTLPFSMLKKCKESQWLVHDTQQQTILLYISSKIIFLQLFHILAFTFLVIASILMCKFKPALTCVRKTNLWEAVPSFWSGAES